MNFITKKGEHIMTEELVKYENGVCQDRLTGPRGMVPLGASLFFDVARFELAQRVAKVFAESEMVPEHFRKNVGNCVIALNLAERMGTDPFMLMQNMYIIHGKPGIEAKLAIALVNNAGKFTSLQYEYNEDRSACTAYAKDLKTGEVVKGATVSLGMAKAEGWYSKKGSKWQTMPEQMLMYRAAMFFARAYCPEAMLGMRTREELHDIIDVTPEGVTTDSAADLTDKLKNGSTGTLDKKLAKVSDEDAFIAEWKNMRSGFQAFVISNVTKFRESTVKVQMLARDKWKRLGLLSPFPLDVEKPEDEPPPEVKEEKQKRDQVQGVKTEQDYMEELMEYSDEIQKAGQLACFGAEKMPQNLDEAKALLMFTKTAFQKATGIDPDKPDEFDKM